MRLFHRKSHLHRLVDTVTDALAPSSKSRLVPGGLGSSRSLKTALANDKARKAGLIAGGLAGLTAGSAGISSVRRRKEGARNDS